MSDSYAKSHLGEDAELYALGSLSDGERAAVDAHLDTCSACRRRVGEAEETLLHLERNYRPAASPRIRVTLPWAAIAAAFLLGLVPSLWFIVARAPQPAISDHDAAVVAMVDSHFSHAQFATLPGEHAPPAKVVYARDGSWVYVIVAQPRSYGIALRRGDLLATAGTTHVAGTASELFVKQPKLPIDAMYLLDDRGKQIAKATLVTLPRR